MAGHRIKLMQLNAQDLFLKLVFPVTSREIEVCTEPQWQLMGADNVALKPLAKLRGLARAIDAEAPDVVFMNEVGGADSLRHFARLFLADRFEPFMVDGQARRGIGNGFLVRRTLVLRPELHSHRNLPAPFRYPHEADPARHPALVAIAPSLELEPPDQRTLSRDVAELRLIDDTDDTGRSRLVILLVHLKSPFDPDRIDPGGVVRRTAEVQAVLALYNRVRAADGGPVIVVGDMNCSAGRRSTAAEFLPVYAETDLEDVLELAALPFYERITQMSFFLDEINARQLDYIFLPAALRPHLVLRGTAVHRYCAEDGSRLELPLSSRERASLPSDHYPLVALLDDL